DAGSLRDVQSLRVKLSGIIIKESDEQVKETPYVQIRKANGEKAGFSFHGAPGGHEFTSFVLTLYNMASSGQPIDPSLKSTIESINKDVHMTIMVSLSCTMCPDLVVAAGRLASLNPHIHVDVYDLNHFTELKDKYHVMSVPCFVIDDKQPEFGKKNVEQLTSLIMN
ncbi:MAG: thioredoxin family protein, partial [Sharpea porci]